MSKKKKLRRKYLLSTRDILNENARLRRNLIAANNLIGAMEREKEAANQLADDELQEVLRLRWIENALGQYPDDDATK